MSPSDPEFIKQLMNGIRQELQLFEHLEQLLSAECSALEQRKVESLTELLKLKESTLSQIEAQVRFRLQMFTEKGLASDEQSLISTLNQLPQKQQKLALQLWNKVKNGIDQCHRQNEVNARIAHRSQQNNANMIEILRGGSDKSGLYNPTGKRSSRHTERTRPAATA